MPFMLWTPAMSVGLSELDDDHKQLFYLINRLSDQAASEVSGQAVRDCLFALMRYAERHFSREERVMAACGYPQLDEHRERHKRFVGRITKITEALDAGGKRPNVKVGEELLEFLKDWLTHHILIEDMAYKPFVEAMETEAREAAKSVRGVEISWQV